MDRLDQSVLEDAAGESPKLEPMENSVLEESRLCGKAEEHLWGVN